MTAVATFHFAAQASRLKYAIAPSAAVTATGDSTIGIDGSSWSVVGSANSATADWVLSAATKDSVIVTAPSGAGKACILQRLATITVNGRSVQVTTTAKIYSGVELPCTNETDESDSVFGWGPLVIASAGAGAIDYAYAASITPALSGVRSVSIGALTGSLTINAPTGAVDGALVAFDVIQDGTGGRAVTWNAAYDLPDGLGYAQPIASSRTRWLFIVDGSTLRCLSRVFSVGSVSHTSGSPTLTPGVVNYISGTVTAPVVPDASLWSGACNALTVKCANLATTLQRSGSDTLNGATTFAIVEVYGQAVVLSRGTTALLVSPGA